METGPGQGRGTSHVCGGEQGTQVVIEAAVYVVVEAVIRTGYNTLLVKAYSNRKIKSELVSYAQ